MSLFHRLRSLLRGLLRRPHIESEMAEEFRHHIDMRTRALIDEGLAPKEARRRAHLEFGHVEGQREAARAARGLHFFDQVGFSWLDFKLAFRMLVRYPALTVISVIAMAIAITFGAGFFEFTSQWANPRLPFDPDDRMVGITVRDSESGQLETRILHDLEGWRESLSSVESLGAFRLVGRNLDAGDGARSPTQLTEISPVAFRLTQTPALLGRTLVEEDARADAPAVVVLGYDIWQDRFAGDADVVGHTIRMGSEPTTVVGVMPEGYEFPRSQSLWAPLRLDPLSFAVDASPGVYAFGVLAAGATLDQARAELGTRPLRIGEGRASGAPLVADVIPFPELVYQPVPGFFDPAFVYINLFILALAVLFCANVALLLFARAASRESELVVRNALGASRYRIVLQLFAEALVLGALAAVIGLFGARYGYDWFLRIIEASESKAPFWFVAEISPLTAVYVVGLTLLGAGVAGILPALKVTRSLASGLRTTTAGGGGLHFGGIWTVIIVAQVALTVPLPALGYLAIADLDELDEARLHTSGADYLTARLEVERDLDSDQLNVNLGSVLEAAPDNSFLSGYAASVRELERRLRADPAVLDVAFVDRLPLSRHPYHQVEMDEGAVEPPDERGHRVGRTNVEPGYFETFQAPVVAGRTFDSEDIVSGARVVIVDQPFVDRVLGGRNAVGRLLRFTASERSPAAPDSPWYEVVGVVPSLGAVTGYGLGGVYHPVPREALYPAGLVLHLRADPGAFASTLRSLAADVDASLRVEEATPMDEVARVEAGALIWLGWAIGIATLTALMLSLAGTYSVMSFTVSRRTREIGIRVALGANRGRLVSAIFRRPLLQVVFGIGIGTALLVWSFDYLVPRGPTENEYVLVAIHSVVVLCVTLLSCIVPTRRALRIEPMEALNVEG